MSLFSNLSFTTNVILLIIVLHVFIYIVEKIKKFTTSSDKKSIAILVLGDVGRSPRMQRHGESLLNNLNNNYNIHFIGFIESDIKSSLKNNPRVKLHNINSLRLHNLFGKNKISFLIYALLKVLSEIFSLLWILLLSPSIQSPLTHIIMQNPPSVPIVIIAKYVSLLRSTIFIIDWHNFGFTILALKQKKDGIFVKLYKLIERYIGKTANIHLTVTKSMKTFLIKEWNFNIWDIYVLHDRATKVFLNKHFNEKDDNLLWNDIKKYFINEYKNIKQAKNNNLWMISSTSWTPDEDLNMLVNDNVLANIDNKILKNNNKRNIILFITGKDEGNLKKEFIKKLNKLKLKYIRVIPLFLKSYNNYIHLLKWCDIGLCFHMSSSGLDLPMKIVDMFGVCIPVIAINFNQSYMETVMNITNKQIKTALHELVEHNKHGFVFNTSNELTEYILCVYNDKEKLKEFKKYIQEFREYKWDNEWRKTMEKTKRFSFD